MKANQVAILLLSLGWPFLVKVSSRQAGFTSWRGERSDIVVLCWAAPSLRGGLEQIRREW